MSARASITSRAGHTSWETRSAISTGALPRTDRPYVKQYEALKCMAVYLLVDTSASMVVSSTPTSKHLLATIIAGGVGLAALARLSPVGLLGCGQRKIRFVPSLSRAKVFQWLHELDQRHYDETTNLAGRIGELEAVLKSRCLVVVLSDLHEPEAVAAIKRLAERHDCIVLHLEDPSERGRLRGGFFRGSEAETGRTFVAHGRTLWFPRESSGEALKKAGVDYLLLGTDRPFIAPLRQFLAARGDLARNAR